MKKRIFTLFIFGLIVFVNSTVSAQAFGFYAEKAEYKTQGEFLANTADGAAIVTEEGAVFKYITSGHADSVYFGNNAIRVAFAGGKSDKLVFQYANPKDHSAFNTAKLVFWIKLLDAQDIAFEVTGWRNNTEFDNTDAQLSESKYGLDINDLVNWQMFTIDLSVPYDGNSFDYSQFTSFGFRSRDKTSHFIVDEMHVRYAGYVETSIEDHSLSSVRIYPNPASSQLTIELGSNKANAVDIVNLLGKRVASKVIQSNRVNFDLSNLSEGIYILKLDGKASTKFLIQR